ncbi:MAG: enoyl-CoA hydratase-related protein [Polyangiales bacterium]
MINLSREGSVFVLRMCLGENRFNPEFVAAMNAALDEVERSGTPSALVTTGEGKFYSNGLDLAWMATGVDVVAFTRTVHQLLGRVLCFPRPTVAAVNGHAFAGGGMLMLAHDAAVMREDRGFFCLPEADIGIPFTDPMFALIAARLPQPVLHEACTSARRYGGPDAARAGVVSAALPEAEVLPAAIARAEALAGKEPATLQAIKRGLYAPALKLLEEG